MSSSDYIHGFPRNSLLSPPPKRIKEISFQSKDKRLCLGRGPKKRFIMNLSRNRERERRGRDLFIHDRRREKVNMYTVYLP